ncbi:MAG: hypothetical protein RIS47_1158 [Bacteroidota bacterium]|jgi:FeS assembly SUF system protein
MSNTKDKISMELEKEIVRVLKTIYDPEIPVNIYELGLIYEVDVDDYDNVEITMTLTAPNCPVAETLPIEVQDKIKEIPGTQKVEVKMVFDPPWDKDMMSEEALLELGFL